MDFDIEMGDAANASPGAPIAQLPPADDILVCPMATATWRLRRTGVALD